MIGESIKGFQVVRRLGSGGMGEVWAAEQPIIKTQVAIKLLRSEISAEQQHVQRFFNEAVAVGKIKHAGIVKIFDVGFHDGRAFLIMELLEGETLASRIARAGQLPMGDVADIGRQIASILEATHAVGVTHRDLKPENIFLTPDAELASKERAKILDFGIAKLGMGVTSTGDSMGTPAYMAPEQWSNAAQADARSDVYSLGCVVFEMCCGRPPFVVTSIGEAYTKHNHEAPPQMSSIAADVPRPLDELVARMLSKEPAQRPAMNEIGASFAGIAVTQPRALDKTVLPDAHAGTVVPQGRTTLGSAASSLDASGPSKKPRWLLLGAGVGLAVAVGFIIIIALPGSDSVRAPAAPLESHPTTQPGRAKEPPAREPPAPDAAVVVESSRPDANPWVRLDPPIAPYALGIPDEAPPEHAGFRTSRGIVTPSQPYAIQAHEVTWSEIEPWLAANHQSVEFPPWAANAVGRARLPATGIVWAVAAAYCRSLGGALPSEEQWEYAVRGPLRRPAPWGADALDRQMTHVFGGPNVTPVPVMTSHQDQTPRRNAGAIYDLAGNVQEWTLGLWREDLAGKDESFAQRGETTVRAIRGLPLAAPATTAIQPDVAAYRERLCATGPCVEKTHKLLEYVGFRCVKPLDP